MKPNNQKSHDAPKKLRFADEIGERYGEIECSCKVFKRWLGSCGNVRLSHLLMSFLCTLHTHKERY